LTAPDLRDSIGKLAFDACQRPFQCRLLSRRRSPVAAELPACFPHRLTLTYKRSFERPVGGEVRLVIRDR
jgi:hypothetical protein